MFRLIKAIIILQICGYQRKTTPIPTYWKAVPKLVIKRFNAKHMLIFTYWKDGPKF
jgi:hypothetical protein